MRGLGARFLSPFLRGFSPALLWLLGLLGWCFLSVWLCLCCFCFLAGGKTPANNSSFTPFCFRIPRKLNDHASCSLGNAGIKTLNLIHALLFRKSLKH